MLTRIVGCIRIVLRKLIWRWIRLRMNRLLVHNSSCRLRINIIRRGLLWTVAMRVVYMAMRYCSLTAQMLRSLLQRNSLSPSRVIGSWKLSLMAYGTYPIGLIMTPGERWRKLIAPLLGSPRSPGILNIMVPWLTLIMGRHTRLMSPTISNKALRTVTCCKVSRLTNPMRELPWESLVGNNEEGG